MAQTALVTGASGGLGLEIARELAGRGYDLVLVARSTQKLEQVAQELHEATGVQTHICTADLSTETGAAQVVDFTETEGIRISVLVNNAGFGDCARFADADLSKLTNMVDLNVRALTQLAYYYLGPMLDAHDGRILNIASVAGFYPGPGMATYFASKAYVLSLTEALAEELRGTGVTCTALCPGTTNTSFWNVAEAGELSIARQAVMASPAEVAAYGVKSLMRGKTVAVPGLVNKAMCTGVRFLPRPLVTRIVSRVLA